jgi:predicted PurR-regulated permease PerM
MITLPNSRLVRAATVSLAFLILVATVVLSVWALRVILETLAPVIWILAIAGILSLLLRPVVLSLSARTALSRPVASVLLIVFFLVVVGGATAALVPVLIEQIALLLQFIPVVVERIRDFLAERFPDYPEWFLAFLEPEALRQNLERLAFAAREIGEYSLPVIREAGSNLATAIGTLLTLAVIPVLLFYFLQIDADLIRRFGDQLVFVRDRHRETVVFLLSQFTAIIVAFFRGQLLIALAQGIALAVGFWAIGLQFGFVLGFLFGVINVVPYLGTVIGLGIALPLAFFQPDGGLLLLAMTLGVYVAVQMLEAYLLTPRVMSDKMGMHPAVIIIAIFFWGTLLGGILGMILAVPLTAFLIVAWRLIKRDYLEEESRKEMM